MLGIVVPVFNEADSITRLLSEIEQEIHIEKQVLLVYDFEEDTTIPVVEAQKNDYSYKIDMIRNMYGRGALNAIRTGFIKCSEEYVLVAMADSSDGLDVVDTMYILAEKQGYDLVCGSRYMHGGKQNGGPLLKRNFSRAAGVSLHILSGIPTHDCSNSFKLYRKSMLDEIIIESTGGFEIGMEILVKAYKLGYRITEVPSQWFDRTEGKSNFHMWKWLPNYLKWYAYCIFEPSKNQR